MKDKILHQSNSDVTPGGKLIGGGAGEFDPIKSLENEYDIRMHSKIQVAPIQQERKPIQLDKKYELKTIKYYKDKFHLKIYDA